MPNPLKPEGAVTFDDPHAFVYNDRVYLFASHDFSSDNRDFVLKDWWVWSSSDLLRWRHESTLKPENTCIGRPFDACWATFGVEREGQWFWYFSIGMDGIGVVVSDSPRGPWRDPLGEPLIPAGITATEARDPDVLVDEDGTHYLVFGTFDYFIVKLGDDLLSPAERPRPVRVANAHGPYGAGKTDDKPALHKKHGRYYLSWSGFYAVSDSVYGPYEYRGTVIDPRLIQREFLNQDVHHDRHGTFFSFHGQDYYVTNDHSQPGRSKYYRDSIMTYVHYRDNGDIAPVRIDSLGVGQYDARGSIEAAEYSRIEGGVKRESAFGGFEVQGLSNGSTLYYPNVRHLSGYSHVNVMAACAHPKGGTMIIEDGRRGETLGELELTPTDSWRVFQHYHCVLKLTENALDMVIRFQGPDQEFCRLHRLFFSESGMK
jgi:arabinoxylan arabinofuranohydrolase